MTACTIAENTLTRTVVFAVVGAEPLLVYPDYADGLRPGASFNPRTLRVVLERDGRDPKSRWMVRSCTSSGPQRLATGADGKIDKSLMHARSAIGDGYPQLRADTPQWVLNCIERAVGL